MSKDKKLELYDLEAIQITDKKHAEDILKELLEEEFAMSYSMVLFKVELVELTNKSRYRINNSIIIISRLIRII